MKLIRHLLPVITPLHRALFRSTRGWIGRRFFGIRCLLLEHRGRKSGILRETPLLYVEHQGRYLVVGSNAGQDHPPAWWVNLQADPRAHLNLGAQRIPVTARNASPEEAQALWPVLDGAFRSFRSYREGTARRIPIVILEATGSISASLPDGEVSREGESPAGDPLAERRA